MLATKQLKVATDLHIDSQLFGSSRYLLLFSTEERNSPLIQIVNKLKVMINNFWLNYFFKLVSTKMIKNIYSNLAPKDACTTTL